MKGYNYNSNNGAVPMFPFTDGLCSRISKVSRKSSSFSKLQVDIILKSSKEMGWPVSKWWESILVALLSRWQPCGSCGHWICKELKSEIGIILIFLVIIVTFVLRGSTQSVVDGSWIIYSSYLLSYLLGRLRRLCKKKKWTMKRQI